MGTGPAKGWIAELQGELLASVGSSDFDRQFLLQLTRRLDGSGYPHLAVAILQSTLAEARGIGNRAEFDALVDLGIEVLRRPPPDLAEE